MLRDRTRLVAHLWLRSGYATCGNNVSAFFLDLWHNLPRHVRLRGARADSGFCPPELLELWEQLRLPYVVVAQLSAPVKGLLRGGSPIGPSVLARLQIDGSTEIASPRTYYWWGTSSLSGNLRISVDDVPMAIAGVTRIESVSRNVAPVKPGSSWSYSKWRGRLASNASSRFLCRARLRLRSPVRT